MRVQTIGMSADRSAASPAALVEDAVVLARRWATASATVETPAERATTGRLAALVADPAGLDLAVRFVDRVARPEDPVVAARELAALDLAAAEGGLTGFLDPLDRGLLAAGRRLAPLAPRLVVPLARRRLRSLVGHLVVDSRPGPLGRRLAAAQAEGDRLNLNLLGEAILGEAEADRRAARVRALLERPDVGHVSVKVSSLVPQIVTWDTAGSVARVATRLRPLYEAAAARTPAPLVTLDMEEYRDLDLTIEALSALLQEPHLTGLEAGIALQAYLPDALEAFERVLELARRRTARGGARVKVRLVKGANLAMERVEAELHGWAPAPFATKAEVDASYVRLLDVALRGDVASALRIGVASHNLFDVALAYLLAAERGVSATLDVEMLQGMAPAQARAVRTDVGALVLYTPVVAPRDLEVAVAYLVRRLEETASPENILPALLRRGPGAQTAIGDHEERFRRSVADLSHVTTASRRIPTFPRSRPAGHAAFATTPDTDPALPSNRSRALAALAAPPRAPTSPVLTAAADVEHVVARGLAAGPAWRARDGAARAEVLRAAATEIEARREALWTVMAHEGGKTIGESEPEVGEAADFARYYADRAEELDEIDGARFEPVRLTVVTPPWNFPVAIPIGSALAALAAGSAVILKPAPATPACAEVAAAAVRAALERHGAPADLLQVVRTDESEVGRRLVSHPDVEAVVLTGSLETARLFASWRPELRLVAETSGKNAIVVTPAADLDLAVADVVRSAFGHAGQKCSAASLVIAVGSVARSERFRRQLVDAVRSVRVGWAEDVGAVMGPLIQRPEGKLLRALTSLDQGEAWLVEPRSLDTSGRLWSPGLKEGVAPGSYFHTTECFGPVLGLMTARDLDDAIALQNGTPYGLTGGLHSLDEAEVARWLDRVEVGNAYVNRHITGAIVRRQPFGGWKASTVGPGAKAGGPAYVAQLGCWWPEGLPTRLAEPEPRVARRMRELVPVLAGPDAEADVTWLRYAVESDAFAWGRAYGRDEDPSGLAAEANVLRYRSLPAVTIRAGAGARWVDLVRLLLAAELAGTPTRLSVHPAVASLLPPVRDAEGLAARRALVRAHLDVLSDEDFAEALASGATVGRVRVVGEAGPIRRAAAAAEATLVTGPVLASGRREMLTVLREQVVSRTRHRFGQLPAGAPHPPV